MPPSVYDLCRCPAGVPPFYGTAGWWDHFEQARTFVMPGYNLWAHEAGMVKKESLHPFIEPAVETVRTLRPRWINELPSDDWEKSHTRQIKWACQTEAMCLVKAVLSIVTLDLFTQNQSTTGGLVTPGLIDEDIYSRVFITPAIYTVVGFDADHLRKLFAHYMDSIGNFEADNLRKALVKPKKCIKLLHDIVDGHHVTYEVAQMVVEHLDIQKKLTVEVGARNRQRGMRRASEAILYI